MMLRYNVAVGIGCDVEDNLMWTLTSCNGGHVVQGGSLVGSRKNGLQADCKKDSKKAGVVCCSSDNDEDLCPHERAEECSSKKGTHSCCDDRKYTYNPVPCTDDMDCQACENPTPDTNGHGQCVDKVYYKKLQKPGSSYGFCPFNHFTADAFASYKRSTDEIPTYERSADECATYKCSADECATYKRSADECATYKRSADECATYERSADECATYKRSADECATYKRSADECATYKRSADECATYKRSADECATYERSADECATYKRSADECATYERSADECATYERSADECATYERSADECATHKRSADECATY
ncbi:Adhesive plaque matrix protein [Diplonema papillatum]|nr:Adhesive plaque matrix protein [Diplonema papillatum]